jgi:hypothetical protein
MLKFELQMWYRTGWRIGNIAVLEFWGAWFECRPRYQLSWGSVRFSSVCPGKCQDSTGLQPPPPPSAILKFRKALKTVSFDARHSRCRCVASILCHRSYRSHPSLLLADFFILRLGVTELRKCKKELQIPLGWQWEDEMEAPVIITSAVSGVTSEAGS